jgi:hypothetical protein
MQSKNTTAHAVSIMDLETRAKIQKERHAKGQKERQARRSAELPSEGQLCENGCGSLAKFHLMKSVKTNTGQVLHWYWCCSDHYKKCPAKCAHSEEERRKTSLERYGVEHHTQDHSFIEKREQTCLNRYGVANPISLPEFVAKKQETEISRHGSLKSGYEKRKAVLQKMFGVDNVFQIPGMGRRIQETINARYGGHYAKNKKWKEGQRIKTGYEHPRQNPECEAKRALTCVARYGVTAPYQSAEIRAKGEVTNINKYGVPYPLQSPIFFHSRLKLGYARKTFTFPSGKTIQVQGYEPLVIQELLDSGTSEADILTGIDCPSFFYEFKGKLRRYYPDIFIKSKNLIIEVKSVYTYQKTLAMNHAKAQAVKQAGYNFEFHIKHSQKLSETAILKP